MSEETRDFHLFLHELRRIAAAEESIASSLQTIKIVLASPLAGAVFIFGGKQHMTNKLKDSGPIQIPDTSTGEPVAVVGVDAAGALGAKLKPGSTIAITILDPTVAAFVPDASPLPQNVTDANGNPLSVASMISGKIVPASPLKVNVVTTATYAITNADGTAGDTGSQDFEYAAGVEASEQFIFQTPAQ